MKKLWIVGAVMVAAVCMSPWAWGEEKKEVPAPTTSDKGTRVPSPARSAAAAYYFTRADYSAAAVNHAIKVSAKFEIIVNGPTLMGIPIADRSIALSSVKVDRKNHPAMTNDKNFVLTNIRPGRHKIWVEWLQAVDSTDTAYSVTVPVIPAPISNFRASVPGKSVNIEIEPGLNKEQVSSRGITTASVALPVTSTVKISWTDKPPETKKIKAAKEEKLRMYAETISAARLDEGLLIVEDTIEYRILRGELSEMVFDLPAGVEVVSVEGSYIKDWRRETVDTARRYRVYLDRKVRGTYQLKVVYEKLLKELPVSGLTYPALIPVGVERVRGTVAIHKNSDLDIKIAGSEGLRSIDISRSPKLLQINPIHALGYIKAPYQLTLDVNLKPELDPEVNVEASTMADISESIIEGVAILDYTILNAGIDKLEISLPEDVKAIGIRGRMIRNRKQTAENGRTLIEIRLDRPVIGNYKLFVEYERLLGAPANLARIPFIRPEGVSSVEGFAGITARHNLEIRDKAASNMRKIDPSQLQGSLFDMSESMILRAYSYSAVRGVEKWPDLRFDLLLHGDVSVQDAFIDEARYLTLVQDSGFCVTKAVLSVRNKNRQNLKIALPQGSELWSAFLAGEPVPPVRDEDGRVLIPLPKSDIGEGGRHINFPVEVVYKTSLDTFERAGEIEMVLPETDMIVGKALWQLYLPTDRAYRSFEGNMGKAMIDDRTARDVSKELADFARSLSGNFLRFQAKAKQSEAKQNLGSIFTTQVAHFGEKNAYGNTFKEINWSPEGKNMYAYFMGDDRIKNTRGQRVGHLKIQGTKVDNESFLTIAVGNMDNDPFVDIWAINQDKQLINLANDVTDTYSPLYEKLMADGLLNRFGDLAHVQEQMRQSEIRGLLSLRIDVPAEGKLVRFEKLFPGAKGEKLRVVVKYMPDVLGKGAKFISRLFAVAIAAGIIIVAALLVRRSERLAILRRHWWMIVMLTMAALILIFRAWFS